MWTPCFQVPRPFCFKVISHSKTKQNNSFNNIHVCPEIVMNHTVNKKKGNKVISKQKSKQNFSQIIDIMENKCICVSSLYFIPMSYTHFIIICLLDKQWSLLRVFTVAFFECYCSTIWFTKFYDPYLFIVKWNCYYTTWSLLFCWVASQVLRRLGSQIMSATLPTETLGPFWLIRSLTNIDLIRISLNTWALISPPGVFQLKGWLLKSFT